MYCIFNVFIWCMSRFIYLVVFYEYLFFYNKFVLLGCYMMYEYRLVLMVDIKCNWGGFNVD